MPPMSPLTRPSLRTSQRTQALLLIAPGKPRPVCGTSRWLAAPAFHDLARLHNGGLTNKDHESRAGGTSLCGTAPPHGCVLASRQLPIGRPALPLRQSAAEKATRTIACETACGRALGYDTGPELHLCSPEPGHQEV